MKGVQIYVWIKPSERESNTALTQKEFCDFSNFYKLAVMVVIWQITNASTQYIKRKFVGVDVHQQNRLTQPSAVVTFDETIYEWFLICVLPIADMRNF